MSAPEPVTPELLRGMALPRHLFGQDKYELGRVLVVAGSVEVPGAALLAGLAAWPSSSGPGRAASWARRSTWSWR